MSLDKKITRRVETYREQISAEGKEERKRPYEYDRYEIIDGGIPNTLLQLFSAEYFKLPKKDSEGNFIISAETQSGKKEGEAFAESVKENIVQWLLRERLNKLQDYPTILTTVMKDPDLRGIIDPDALQAKNPQDNPKLDQAIKAYQTKIIENIMSEMENNKPFLHMAISERRQGKDNEIIIAGGMRNKSFPADPRILKWFKQKLEQKLLKHKIENVQVKIAIEGESVCGSSVHVARRKYLGDLYQFVKTKVPTVLLKDRKIIAAIAEIARDFHNEFPDEQSLQEYLEKNTTEEDKIRLEGKMYFSNGLQRSEEVSNNKIAMSRSLRKALGVKKGEEIVVYHNPEVKYVLEVIPAFTSKDSFDKEKIGWRVPAINIDALNGKSVVIEKEVTTPNRRAR